MNTDQIIAHHFINESPKEAVQLIENLECEEIVAFVHDIPLELALRVLQQMNNYKVAKCMELIHTDIAVQLIESMNLSSAELLLRQCDDRFREKLLDRINPGTAEKIRQKLRYASDSVGTFMNSKVFSLQKSLTVGEAMEVIKEEKDLKATEIIVVDENGIIAGIVMITQLVFAEQTDRIQSITIHDIPAFLPDSPIQSIIDHPAWHKCRTLPVIERSGALIGSLHYEDVNSQELKKDSEFRKRSVETGTALGELYWIGITGLLQSFGKSE